jgi:hypothetical protein
MSSDANGSAIFRLVTRQDDFGDAVVTFDLVNLGLTSTGRTPQAAWDGVHVFLRYQEEQHTYYASVNRRDDTVVIKKKVRGGPSNGGTYVNLSDELPYSVPHGVPQHVRASIRTFADGAVGISIFVNDVMVVSGIDDGIGGDPITYPGRIGIRGDNCEFLLDNFRVSRPASSFSRTYEDVGGQ